MVVSYRCPKTDDEIVTTIQADKDVLRRMQMMKLTIWVWCPHCMAGHQIKAGQAHAQEERRMSDLTVS
jgi:hypothetical protein